MRRARLLTGLCALLALTVLLTGCFASGATGADAGSSGRLRVALAVPPVQALSPYSNDATVLGKLSVVEGLTVLDSGGAAAPALATSWVREDATTWTFELRKATFHDGTAVTAESVVAALGTSCGPRRRSCARTPWCRWCTRRSCRASARASKVWCSTRVSGR